MSVPKLQVTKNYRLFARSIDNRPLSEKKHKRLMKSMQKNGFLPCFPLACVRDEKKQLIILDGQHRHAFAEALGLAVYFMVLPEPFDIAEVNGTQEKWNIRNFAETYAAQGNKSYSIGLEIADRHGLPIGIAFGLLAGTVSFNNASTDYYGGQFKIKDSEWAETVGMLYSRISAIASDIKGARLIEALMAVAKVTGFDSHRLIAGCERCRDKLVPLSTKDAFLELLEECYNFGRKQLFSLKNEAIMVMRNRNVVVKAKDQKRHKDAA